MSENARPPPLKVDARTRRTREALGDALMALIVEKPFDSITVQDVLDRAGVGRSTFYAHYSDKDDLFFSDVEEFWEMMAGALSRNGDRSERVAPVSELFAHVGEMHTVYRAMVDAGRIHEVLELGHGHFARAFERRFEEIPRASGIPAPTRAALANAQAGALFSLLTWWITRGMPGTPAEMDALFHRMFWSGVGR